MTIWGRLILYDCTMLQSDLYQIILMRPLSVTVTVTPHLFIIEIAMAPHLIDLGTHG
jgi:hypothetical protein